MISPVVTAPVHARAPEALAALTYGDLMRDCFAAREKFSNVGIGAFKNGKRATFTPEEVALLRSATTDGELAQLTKSFRLTNVQLYVPQLRAMAHDFYQTHGLALTVNFYFTPNAHAQCFDYHSDPQYTHVVQIFGEKEWSLLEGEDGHLLSETSEALPVLLAFKRGLLKRSKNSADLRASFPTPAAPSRGGPTTPRSSITYACRSIRSAWIQRTSSRSSRPSTGRRHST